MRRAPSHDPGACMTDCSELALMVIGIKERGIAIGSQVNVPYTRTSPPGNGGSVFCAGACVPAGLQLSNVPPQ